MSAIDLKPVELWATEALNQKRLSAGKEAQTDPTAAKKSFESFLIEKLSTDWIKKAFSGLGTQSKSATTRYAEDLFAREIGKTISEHLPKITPDEINVEKKVNK